MRSHSIDFGNSLTGQINLINYRVFFTETVSNFAELAIIFAIYPKKGGNSAENCKVSEPKMGPPLVGSLRQLDTGKIGKLKNLAANDLLGFV